MDLNLVIVDGSVTAQNAARLAVQIAQLESQRILSLYIVDEALVLESYVDYRKELGRDDQPDSRAELIEWFEALGSSALNQLRQICKRADIPVETQILFGGVPELILDNAAQAQILTLGRRGRGHANAPDHLGSNFRHIAHRAHIPLLVGGDSYSSVRHLFLLRDGSPRFDLALDWTVRLQRSLTADVTVIATDQVDPNILSLNIREQMFRHNLIDYQHRPLRDENGSGIQEAIDDSGADLIVTGGYRHPEILEWLVGGKIDQILRKSQIPVLIA